MKRDVELCRQIMLSIEESESEYVKTVRIEVENVDKLLVRGHVSLLLDEGYLAGQSMQPRVNALLVERNIGMGRAVRDDHSPAEVRLSALGHEFLDVSRQSKVWNWTKTQAAKVPGITFSMLMPMMKAYVVQQAKDLGIDLV